MTNLTLKSSVKVLSCYSGKSKFPFWKNVKTGDTLEISHTFSGSLNQASNGMYSPTIAVQNTKTKEVFVCGYNEFVRYLSRIEFEECQA